MMNETVTTHLKRKKFGELVDLAVCVLDDLDQFNLSLVIEGLEHDSFRLNIRRC